MFMFDAVNLSKLLKYRTFMFIWLNFAHFHIVYYLVLGLSSLFCDHISLISVKSHDICLLIILIMVDAINLSLLFSFLIV